MSPTKYPFRIWETTLNRFSGSGFFISFLQNLSREVLNTSRQPCVFLAKFSSDRIKQKKV